MIYSYFRHSTYLSRIWLEAVCHLLLKTQPSVKPEVQEEEMSRPRDSVLSWHFEMVYFVQNGLSAADAVSANTGSKCTSRTLPVLVAALLVAM